MGVFYCGYLLLFNFTPMIIQLVSDLNYIPQRIVSLVPSQTELLFHLGLDEVVVGITKYCVHPDEWLNKKTLIGGTKNINIGLIESIQPDLIIANKEENIKEQVEALANNYPVWVSDVTDLGSALQMIRDIGALTNTTDQALQLVNEINSGFAALPLKTPAIPAAYLIWRKPYMTVGGDTFINDMMQRCGLQNVFGESKRYPTVTPEMLKDSGCHLLLLSSEPYPFKQQHIIELQQQLPGMKILLVDGELFSWYGSRLLKTSGYFQSLQQHIRYNN